MFQICCRLNLLQLKSDSPPSILQLELPVIRASFQDWAKQLWISATIYQEVMWIVVKSMDPGARQSGLNFISTTNQTLDNWCDVTFCTSVSLSIMEQQITYLIWLCGVRKLNKLMHVKCLAQCLTGSKHSVSVNLRKFLQTMVYSSMSLYLGNHEHFLAIGL